MGAVNFWLDIVATAYRLDVDDNAWLDGVAEVVRPRLDRGFGIYGMYYYAPSPERFRAEPQRFYHCPSEVIAFADRALAGTTPEVVRHVLLSHPFGTTSDALGRPRLTSRLPPTAPPFGIADSVAVNAVDPVGNGVMLCGPMNEIASLPRRERSLWTRVTAHIAAGHRLRIGLAAIGRSPDHVDAEINPSGRVRHATGSAAHAESRATLVRAIKNVDRARSRKRKDPLEALELWTALVSGRWSIVDRIDTDGRRFFVAWRNDPAVPDHRSLTERELQSASYAALGHSN